MLLLTLMLLSGTIDYKNLEPALYFGTNQSPSIRHLNGQLAWTGVIGNYSSDETSFFHANGIKAWGGKEPGRVISEEAFIKYDNGQKAWGGLKQSDQYAISDHAKFYHKNGQIAWGGLDQNSQYMTSEHGKFFHPNGEMAWDGTFGGKVYYDNGLIAWEGKKGSIVFDQLGKKLGNADFIHINLGDFSWLYISDDQFLLTMNLGLGYDLKVTSEKVTLDLYGHQFNF